MTHVATLICHPSAALIGSAEIASASAVLPDAGSARVLAPGVAVDIPFAPPLTFDNARWSEAVRAVLGAASIDVVAQPLAGRRKRLLVADMDSTLIEQECIDELAEAVGLRDEVAAITLRSVRGEVGFDAALRERVALLRGLDVATAIRVVDRITPMSGAQALAATMRAHGALTAICSGGFTLFTAHVAQQLGFERHFANTLLVDRGRLTGEVQEPIIGRASKRTILRQLREELDLAPESTLAVGDGANDLAMLEEAGLGVAFHAQPSVAAVARARIDHGDLTALLYLQGYALEDIRE